jgi:23S rRNA (uracil1939-C5)-methyltransferase
VKKVFIESLNLDAQGVARPANEDGSPGKVLFVDGALPGEIIDCDVYKVKSKFEIGRVTHIYKPSSARVNPPCPSFGICGGCSMQHLDGRTQLAMKQRVLEDNLKYLARVKPDVLLRPIAGPTWGYRYRGRLSVFKIPKGRVMVGFHQNKSTRITDMETCAILPRHISDLLTKWRELIASLEASTHIAQIEFAVGEGVEPDSQICVFVLRHMMPLSEADQEKIRQFAIIHGIDIWLQPAGLDSAHPFYPLTSSLRYRLPEFDIEIPFRPTDFTQVNHQINRVLVGRAIRLLDPKPTDRVLDLFCGIGNFTLPLARIAKDVFGIEGSQSLTDRALQNAIHNDLENKVDFACANLFEISTATIKSWGKANKWLIDPPRDGAMALVQALADMAKSKLSGDIDYLPSRIVYVSCNPATLSRDTAILVNEAGYRLHAAGVVNMFPHTSHIESVAVFER